MYQEYQVPVPPDTDYVPDLNPIEFGWKDLKRELGSLLDFDQMIENAQEMAVQLLWHRKKSYSGYWDRKFTDGYLFETWA